MTLPEIGQVLEKCVKLFWKEKYLVPETKLKTTLESIRTCEKTKHVGTAGTGDVTKLRNLEREHAPVLHLKKFLIVLKRKLESPADMCLHQDDLPETTTVAICSQP